MAKIFWLGLALFLTNCLAIKKRAYTIRLKSLMDKRAEGVKFSPPPHPYTKQSHPVLDALWRNEQKASSISYFSNCSKIQKTLKDFQRDSFPPKYKIIKETQLKEALYSILEISPPHQTKSHIGIYTMKKKSCWFNFHLMAGSYESFKKEEPVFKTFLQGMKIP